MEATGYFLPQGCLIIKPGSRDLADRLLTLDCAVLNCLNFVFFVITLVKFQLGCLLVCLTLFCGILL